MVTAVQIANIIHARAVLGALVVVAVLVAMLVAAIASSGVGGCSSMLLRNYCQCCRTTVSRLDMCVSGTMLRQPATNTHVMLDKKSRERERERERFRANTQNSDFTELCHMTQQQHQKTLPCRSTDVMVDVHSLVCVRSHRCSMSRTTVFVGPVSVSWHPCHDQPCSQSKQPTTALIATPTKWASQVELSKPQAYHSHTCKNSKLKAQQTCSIMTADPASCQQKTLPLQDKAMTRFLFWEAAA